MSHTYRFEQDDYEDPRAVRRMRQAAQQRETERQRREVQIEESARP